MRSRLPTVFWVVLAVQTSVPAVQLFADRPARFGWQMFSTAKPALAFVVNHTSGAADSVAAADILVRVRQEIDVPSVVVPHLCGRPDVESVTVVRGVTDRQATTVPCP